MRRDQLNLCLNILLYASLVLMALSGFALDQHFGHAPGEGRGALWLGLGHHDWGELHSVAAWVFVALGLAHLLLHAAWIKNLFARAGEAGRNQARLGFGLVLLLLVVAVALPLMLPSTPGTGEGGGEGWRGGEGGQGHGFGRGHGHGQGQAWQSAHGPDAED
jgi:hypothetical protein